MWPCIIASVSIYRFFLFSFSSFLLDIQYPELALVSPSLYNRKALFDECQMHLMIWFSHQVRLPWCRAPPLQVAFEPLASNER